MDILKKDRQVRAIYIATFIFIFAFIVLLFCFILHKHFEGQLNQRQVSFMFASVDVPKNTYPGDTLVFEEVIKLPSQTEPEDGVYLLARTNHQVLKLFLDGGLLFESGKYDPEENPGMDIFLYSFPKIIMGKSSEQSSPPRTRVTTDGWRRFW